MTSIMLTSNAFTNHNGNVKESGCTTDLLNVNLDLECRCRLQIGPPDRDDYLPALIALAAAEPVSRSSTGIDRNSRSL